MGKNKKQTWGRVATDLLLFLIFTCAIDTLTFSSIMYIMEYFGNEIGVAVAIQVMCLSVAACIVQLWLVGYFLMDFNIVKYIQREKKCSCNELEYTNQYADSWKCKKCKKIYLNKERRK